MNTTEHTLNTDTANEIFDIASHTAYWNSEGRDSQDLLDYAYTAAAQFGLPGDTVTELIEAAWAARTGTRGAYLATARKIISDA